MATRLLLKELDSRSGDSFEEAKRRQRQDAPEDFARTFGETVERVFSSVFSAPLVRGATLSIARQVEDRAERETARVLSAVGAREVFGAVDQGLIENFVEQNVDLVTNVSQQMKLGIKGALLRAFQSGDGRTNVRKEIQRVTGIQTRRARTIARDQIGSLNGQIARQRFQAAGANRFQWVTARDERVRDEHAALDGQIFSWAKPPSEGLPGEPINCRCVAVAVLV